VNLPLTTLEVPPDFMYNPYGRLLEPRSECEVRYAILVAHKGDYTLLRRDSDLFRELRAAHNNAKRISVTQTKEPEHPFRS
jgi:hypothetical protein